MQRPESPDFWKLSRILIDQDQVRDNETMTIEDQVSIVIDMKTLTYVAEQRAMRISGPHSTARFQCAAAWMDAFMAGAAYQALKDRENQT